MLELLAVITSLVLVLLVVSWRSPMMSRPMQSVLLVVLLLAIVFCGSMGLNKSEGFTGAPLDYNMGKCSGLRLSGLPDVRPAPDSYAGLRLPPVAKSKYSLLSDVTIFTPTGDGVVLTEDPVASKFPSVDGSPDKPKHLFMFAHNMCHPDCCPSTYSCDRGCVCTTEKQRELLNQRGRNRTVDDEPSM